MSKNEKLPENIKPEMIGEKRYVCLSEDDVRSADGETAEFGRDGISLHHE